MLPEDVFLYLEPIAIIYMLFPRSVDYIGLGTKEMASFTFVLTVLLDKPMLSIPNP